MATMAAELKLEPSREVDVEQDHRSWRTVPPTSSIGSLRPRPHVRGWAKGVLCGLFSVSKLLMFKAMFQYCKYFEVVSDRAQYLHQRVGPRADISGRAAAPSAF